MDRDDRLTRRRALEVTGIAVAAALAGCGGPGSEGNGGTGTESNGDNGSNGDGAESGGEQQNAGEWADIDEIVLQGEIDGWIGVEPAVIEGETNPTLLLSEGESYDLTWENADGEQHNIALRTEDSGFIEEYRTDLMDQEGETQTLEFEATSEMGEYICEHHTDAMSGAIEFQGDDGGNGGNETGEADGNQSEENGGTDGNESEGNESENGTGSG